MFVSFSNIVESGSAAREAHNMKLIWKEDKDGYAKSQSESTRKCSLPQGRAARPVRKAVQ